LERMAGAIAPNICSTPVGRFYYAYGRLERGALNFVQRF
jgi:hypothetical protein